MAFARVRCGACGAFLFVPVGMRRCPKCDRLALREVGLDE